MWCDAIFEMKFCAESNKNLGACIIFSCIFVCPIYRKWTCTIFFVCQQRNRLCEFLTISCLFFIVKLKFLFIFIINVLCYTPLLWRSRIAVRVMKTWPSVCPFVCPTQNYSRMRWDREKVYKGSNSIKFSFPLKGLFRILRLQF